MASGNYLCTWNAREQSGPATNYATQDILTGAASPAELIPVTDFDGAGGTEYADFYGVLPAHYDGGGVTVTIVSSSGQSTNAYVWQGAFRAIPDDAEDLDTTAHTYDYNTVTVTSPSAIGEVSYDNITFTDGADMDSLAAGQAFILRIKRDSTHASDSMTLDASIHELILKES